MNTQQAVIRAGILTVTQNTCVGFFRCVNIGKKVLAHFTVVIDAQLVLFVKGLIYDQRQTSQPTEYRIQNFITELQCSPQLTTNNFVGDILNHIAFTEVQIGAGWIRAAGIGKYFVVVITNNQCLAIADKNVPDRIVLFYNIYFYQFGKVFN